jgi:hypothetical protein
MFASPVTIHYGLAPFEGRRAPSLARWMARTVVFDTARGYPVNDLRAPITLTAPVDSTPPSTTSSPLELTVRDAQASNAAALRATVRLRNTGATAVSTLWRTVLLAFEVVTPSGRRVLCDGNLREPNPFREFFVRIGPGVSRSMRVEPDTYCPAGTFDEAGVYRTTASFETSADGEPWSRSPAFTGRLTSLPFVFRIARGYARYVPFGLRIEGRGS